MITATKLQLEARRCDSRWVGGSKKRCTQIAKYRVGSAYYCTTHAKIQALKEILDD